MVKRKGKKSLFWACLLILPLIFASIPIHNVYAQFTYGNWDWDGTNEILTIIANASNNEGNTEANAYGFQDIVDSGLVPSTYYNVSASVTQFEFSFRIIIGDGSEGNTTWLVDGSKEIVFSTSAISDNYQSMIDVKAYANLRLGTLVDASDKTTKDGCHIIRQDSGHLYVQFIMNSGTVYFYSSILEGGRQTDSLRDWGGIGLTAYNCFLQNLWLYSGDSWILYRVNLHHGQYGIWRAQGTYEDVYIYDCYFGFYAYGSETYMVKNVKFRNNNYDFRAISITTDKPLINVDSDSWAFTWGDSSTARFLRQYEFDLNITDNAGNPLENVNVTIAHYGENAGQDFNGLTASNGSIPTQVFSMGFYNQTGGDTIYDYNPYIITATKEGYQPYVGNFTLNDKTKWNIILQPKREFFPYFGLGVVFALMIGLVFGLAFIYEKRK